APHQVAVIRAAQAFRNTGVAVSVAEEYLRARAPRGEALVATKDGDLVCVLAGAMGASGLTVPDWLGELAARAVRELAVGDRWRAVIRRVHPRPAGIPPSSRAARGALGPAVRVARPRPVIPP